MKRLLFILILFASIHAYCFQEQANVSTACGGLATGNYSNSTNFTVYNWTFGASPVIDGNYTTWDGAWTGEASVIYANYTRPIGAGQGSMWQINTQASFGNASISPKCWLSNNTTNYFRIISCSGANCQNSLNIINYPYYDGIGYSHIDIYSGSYFMCSNSSSGRPSNDSDWIIIKQSPSPYIFEEAMWWNINTTVINIVPNSPDNDSSSTLTYRELNFTGTDNESLIFACSLFLDGVQNTTNSTVNNNTLTNFTITSLSVAQHNWSINCTDSSGNTGTSETRFFTVSSSGGGGGGGGGGGYSPPATSPDASKSSTPTLAETTTPTAPYPDPNTNPDYYANPPATTGQATIADKITEITHGEIVQLPYACTPTFHNAFPFVGSDIADRFICEFKGIESLYIKRLTGFLNGAIILLALLVFFSVRSEKKSQANWMLAFAVIAFAIGFDFIAFSITALLLMVSGAKIT